MTAFQTTEPKGRLSRLMSSTAAALALAAACFAAAPAAAIDVSPGDYSVLPAGTNLGCSITTSARATRSTSMASATFRTRS